MSTRGKMAKDGRESDWLTGVFSRACCNTSQLSFDTEESLDRTGTANDDLLSLKIDMIPSYRRREDNCPSPSSYSSRGLRTAHDSASQLAVPIEPCFQPALEKDNWENEASPCMAMTTADGSIATEEEPQMPDSRALDHAACRATFGCQIPMTRGRSWGETRLSFISLGTSGGDTDNPHSPSGGRPWSKDALEFFMQTTLADGYGLLLMKLDSSGNGERLGERVLLYDPQAMKLTWISTGAVCKTGWMLVKDIDSVLRNGTSVTIAYSPCPATTAGGTAGQRCSSRSDRASPKRKVETKVKVFAPEQDRDAQILREILLLERRKAISAATAAASGGAYSPRALGTGVAQGRKEDVAVGKWSLNKMKLFSGVTPRSGTSTSRSPGRW